jgi:hypothetical protein
LDASPNVVLARDDLLPVILMSLRDLDWELVVNHAARSSLTFGVATARLVWCMSLKDYIFAAKSDPLLHLLLLLLQNS